MKTLDQIKDEIAKENDYANWDELKRLKTAQSYFHFWLSHSDDIAERYRREGIKGKLEEELNQIFETFDVAGLIGPRNHILGRINKLTETPLN